MQTLITFVLLGLVSSTYAVDLGGALGGLIKTGGEVVGETAEAVADGLHLINPFQQGHQQGQFQYPPFGQYPQQYWNSLGVHFIYGTPGYCSCPAGFFNQGNVNQGYQNQPGVFGTLSKTVEQTASVIPKVVGEIVQQTKESVSHTSHHGY